MNNNNNILVLTGECTVARFMRRRRLCSELSSSNVKGVCSCCVVQTQLRCAQRSRTKVKRMTMHGCHRVYKPHTSSTRWLPDSTGPKAVKGGERVQHCKCLAQIQLRTTSRDQLLPRMHAWPEENPTNQTMPSFLGRIRSVTTQLLEFREMTTHS